MTNYNKSEIMKKAWSFYKSSPSAVFANCLSLAWDHAKATVTRAKTAAMLEKLSDTAFVNGMQITVAEYTCTLKRWTKGSHDRVYINNVRSRESDGWVDLNNMNAHLRWNYTSLARIARAIGTMKF